MLDASGANDKILYRWLGRMVAEPEWVGESVNFFVRDEHGGRLEEVACEPATRSDLEQFLADELAALRERIQRAQPETATEQAIHKAVGRAFRDLTEDPYRGDLDDYFFRYRDANGHWRLVWCWGYQRTDQENAPAVICTDPDCNLLFVRRPGGKHKCPSCAALQAALRANKRFPWKWVAALLLLLLLLGGAALYWLARPTELIASPKDWAGPVGSRIPYKVLSNSLLRHGQDVSTAVSVESDDPAVCRFDASDRSMTAAAPGKTIVHFRLGNLKSEMPVVVAATVAKAEPAPLAIPVPAAKSAVAVGPAPAVARKGPLAVKILSDQGPAVRIPVGLEFDDFHVDAQYPDGKTRLVTKKAVYRMSQPPEKSPVAADKGRLIGVRPGRTVVEAEFEGVRSQQGLEVTVSPELDADELRVTPKTASLLPGETITMDVVGLHQGKQLGHLTELGTIAWKSSAPDVVRCAGPAASSLKLGRAQLTAQLGKLTSPPADVEVVATINEPLQAEPGAIRIQVGESARIGTDLAITRGTLDFSSQCMVTPQRPDVVRYNPESNTLVGQSPGTSLVQFAHRDQMAVARVEVAPKEPIAGQVLVEPAAATLVPGQELDLRVFTVDAEGNRVDRTEAAELISSDGRKVLITDRTACALAAGAATIAAKLPGIEQPGVAEIVVKDEQITELMVDPAEIEMGVGDRERLRILGRAPSGTYEIFPQADLNVAVGGPNPAAIKIVGTTGVDGLSPGTADVTVSWRGLSRTAAVIVGNGTASGLEIDPGAITIHPGDRLDYLLSAVRDGRRRLVGPQDGVRLSVSDHGVAQPGDELSVQGVSPGQTAVVAEYNGQRATSQLTVEPGAGPAVRYDGGGRYAVDRDGRVVRSGRRVYRDGRGWQWVDEDGREIVGQGPGGVTTITAAPAGPVIDRLRIDPEKILLQVGQSTPVLKAIGQTAGGTSVQVPALLESMDPALLAPDPALPGAFLAKGLGGTQVRASYGGREAFAEVTVSGKRFMAVNTKLNEGDADFDVTIDVTADAAEGALEYRVFAAGQPPPEKWVAAEASGDRRHAVLTSPRFPYGSPSKRYHVIIEARDAAGRTVQSYPFTFRLRPDIQRTDDGKSRAPPNP